MKTLADQYRVADLCAAFGVSRSDPGLLIGKQFKIQTQRPICEHARSTKSTARRLMDRQSRDRKSVV